LREIGAKYNATPAQVTLAWMIKEQDDIIPIPGSKNIKYIEENLGALKVPLNEEDLKTVRKLAEEINSDLGKDTRYQAAHAGFFSGETPPLSEWKE
jgi:diketogulonate reductase-like aldo/keto reductase